MCMHTSVVIVDFRKRHYTKYGALEADLYEIYLEIKSGLGNTSDFYFYMLGTTLWKYPVFSFPKFCY
jgi:hypothetical protein